MSMMSVKSRLGSATGWLGSSVRGSGREIVPNLSIGRTGGENIIPEENGAQLGNSGRRRQWRRDPPT